MSDVDGGRKNCDGDNGDVIANRDLEHMIALFALTQMAASTALI